MTPKHIVYNKLVRDGIPELIEREGKTCAVEVLPEDSYLENLKKKLREELLEYETSEQPIELADMLEVIYTIGDVMGLRKDALEVMRRQKRDDRGGFEERLFLRWVEE